MHLKHSYINTTSTLLRHKKHLNARQETLWWKGYPGDKVIRLFDPGNRDKYMSVKMINYLQLFQLFTTTIHRILGIHTVILIRLTVSTADGGNKYIGKLALYLKEQNSLFFTCLTFWWGRSFEMFGTPAMLSLTAPWC